MNARPALHRHRTHQRGAAVVTALLMVTLAVVIVSGMLWRQQVQIRSIENQRLTAQAAWIERAAVDWARLILRDDQRRSNVDYLGRAVVGAGGGDAAVRLPRRRAAHGPGRETFVPVRPHRRCAGALQPQQPLYLERLGHRARGGDRPALAAGLPPPASNARHEPVAGGADRAVSGTRGARGVARRPARAAPPDTAADLLAIPGYNPDMVARWTRSSPSCPNGPRSTPTRPRPEVPAAAIDKLPLDRARELVRQRDAPTSAIRATSARSCAPWRRRQRQHRRRSRLR